jgi:hypothetical protein
MDGPNHWPRMPPILDYDAEPIRNLFWVEIDATTLTLGIRTPTPWFRLWVTICVACVVGTFYTIVGASSGAIRWKPFPTEPALFWKGRAPAIILGWFLTGVLTGAVISVFLLDYNRRRWLIIDDETVQLLATKRPECRRADVDRFAAEPLPFGLARIGAFTLFVYTKSGTRHWLNTIIDRRSAVWAAGTLNRFLGAEGEGKGLEGAERHQSSRAPRASAGRGTS